MDAPLSGYRILDLSAMISGPLATMWLADQGAEVIKVEPPTGGDLTRAGPNRRGDVAAVFANNNRNKRSLALDLKQSEGRELLLQLAADADVFVQNFRPGVIDRMGLGEDPVRVRNPGIIYCSISGFGATGPYATQPVYDPLIQALSGLATVQAGADDVRPRLVRTILPDKLTGMAAAQAITAALLARERGGPAQHVRISMLDTVVAFLWSSDMAAQTFADAPTTQQGAASFIDLIYETRDGYISVAVQSNREWEALTGALERPQWLDDPRFATPALRQEHIDARLAMIQEVLREDRAATWLTRLREAGVPCAPVLTRSQVIEHPQLMANETLILTDHPRAGRLRQTQPPARFSAMPWSPPTPAPALGADTEQVLAGLGYDAAAIAAMRARGLFGAPPADEG